MYDTGEHFPVKLNEIVQVTQQVYLFAWHVELCRRIGRETTLEGETTPYSCPQKRLWLGSLMASPALSPFFFVGQSLFLGLLTFLYCFVLGRGASIEGSQRTSAMMTCICPHLCGLPLSTLDFNVWLLPPMAFLENLLRSFIVKSFF